MLWCWRAVAVIATGLLKVAMGETARAKSGLRRGEREKKSNNTGGEENVY